MGITNLDRLELEGTEIYPPILTQVTKTVGVGKDFELFHDAMKWLEKQTTKQGGWIQLLLDAGTHLIGEPSTFNEGRWVYYSVSATASISGASEATTIITMPSTDDGGNYPAVVEVLNSQLTIEDLTIDPDIGGYPNTGTVSFGYAINAGLFLTNVTQKNFDVGAGAGQNGYLQTYSGTVDTCNWGSFMQGNKVYFNGTTFVDCVVGIHAGDNGVLCRIKNVTFTTCTTDTTLTINEMQYDGSLIANGTSAITLKA